MERFIQLTFIRLPFGIIMHPRVNPVQRNCKREITNAARHAILFDLWRSVGLLFRSFSFFSSSFSSSVSLSEDSQKITRRRVERI